MAREQRITAVELNLLGVIDVLVAARGSAGDADFLDACAAAVSAGLALPGPAPLPDRVERFTRATDPRLGSPR